MEAAVASSGDHRPNTFLNLPPGYHFAPTDDELIVHYLRRRIEDLPPLLPIFKDADVISCRPEQITEDFKECGEDRWYFFTKRYQKYTSGSRPNRTTPDKGFWKATGPQRMIYAGKKEERSLVGRVRTLVFYNAPKVTGQETTSMDKRTALSEGKTSWTMYEYENLTSEAEAADQNVNKLAEWVLCTIQKQKKEEGKEGSENKVQETNEGKGEIKEGSPADEKKVKETKGKGKINADGKKRKTKMEAENGTDKGLFQALYLMKRSKVPMLPAHLQMVAPEEGYERGMFAPEEGVEVGMFVPEEGAIEVGMYAPEEGDDMGMFGFEYTSCPRKSSPVPIVQQHESPRSETLSPCITDNDYHDPNMAPLHESTHAEMTCTAAGGNYSNIGSDGMSRMPSHGSPLAEIFRIAGNINNSFSPVLLTLQPQQAPHLRMEYEASSFSGYSYHNIAPNMVAHQPATDYMYPLPAAAVHLGGGAHNTTGHHNSYGYAAGGELMAMITNSGTMSSQSLGGCFADSSQFHSGPSVLGQGRAVMPAVALPRQDQVTART